MRKYNLKHSVCVVVYLAFLSKGNASSINLTCSSSLVSGSTSSSCSGSDSAITSTSNTGSTGSSPQSYVTVNNNSNHDLDIASSTNTKPINLNLFVTSGGTPSKVTVDFSGKYNDQVSTYGLTQSPNASSMFLVGELISDLSVNLSGYVGNNGYRASEICANKILAGDFGSTVLSQFKNRCNDGSTANPCATAKIRSTCDAQDLSNINTYMDSNESNLYCPTGYTYMSGQDAATSPNVPITVVSPIAMRKCVAGSWTEPLRMCQRVGTKYSFHMVTYFPDRDNIGVLASSSLFSYAWTDTYQESNAGGYWHNEPGGHNFYAGRVCTASSSSGRDCYFTLEIPSSAPSPTFTFQNWRYDWGGYTASVSGDTCNLSGTCNSGNISYGQPSVVTSVNYVIYRTGSCQAYENDLGTTTSHGNSSYYHAEQTYWRSSGNSCSGIPRASGTFGSQQPAYSDYGVFTGHGLTSSSDSLNYDGTNPISSSVDPVCNDTSCPSGTTSLTTATNARFSLTTGDAQAGSYGGTITALVYKITGTETYTYANGSNGVNGTNDLTVPSYLKKCYNKQDNRAVPNVAFYYNTYSIFNFSLSQKTFTNNFPARTQGEAVQVYKKLDPSFLDLVKESTCPSCP